MDDTIAAVRGFNRYYTRVIGALGEGHLDSPYTLTEARILYELAQHESVDVAELRRGLALDAGYVTRILTRFDADHLITRRRSASDARRQVVALTKQGRAAFGKLNRRASSDVSRLLSALSDDQRARLRGAMDTIRTVLEPEARASNVTVRAPEPGDLGWIVQRNGELYAAEYGWDATFEALVATIVGDFAADHDAARERAWIAGVDGQRAGCIMCVRADGSADVAKLRLLLVEPSARGLGVGRRLVTECVDFARGAGYSRLVLWTQSILAAARHLYVEAGFELVESAPHRSFGADLVEETWALEL
jgi:DNA-binding MarR family transcriptional regulator/GNAT superfamily N-acetyltransferase